MRDVAVTEGDKVEAQIQLGYDVYGYGVGDLVQGGQRGQAMPKSTRLVQAYLDEYDVAPALRPGGERHASPAGRRRASKSGMRAFLQGGNFKAFTTTFEDLHGLAQLPGLAVQRLMARRLRLWRRRRLEDRRPGAGHEGDERRAAGRTSASWKITPTTSAPAAIRCWARTCWRSARRSPPASRAWRSCRSRSAARPTRCA